MKGTSGPALRNVIMSRDSGVSDVAIEKVMNSDFGRITLNEYKTIIDALIEFSPDRLGEGDLGGFSMRKKFIKAAQLNEFFKVEKYEKDRDTSEAEKKRGNLKKDLPSTLMTQHLRGYPQELLLDTESLGGTETPS